MNKKLITFTDVFKHGFQLRPFHTFSGNFIDKGFVDFNTVNAVLGSVPKRFTTEAGRLGLE